MIAYNMSGCLFKFNDLDAKDKTNKFVVLSDDGATVTYRTFGTNEPATKRPRAEFLKLFTRIPPK